ncbi:MAG: AI-2E family transporter [Elusimicrobia bacterium]|nr:AI-2E family transporter [Elusimicrobiota bacterium]
MTPPTAAPEPAGAAPLAKLSAARKASYAIFLAVFVGMAVLNLGPLTLAGLFAYLILDLAHRRLRQAMPESLARWAALASFLVAAFLLGLVFWEFIRQAVRSMPHLMATVLPRIDDIASRYGFDLPFDTLHEFREAITDAIRENAVVVTRFTGLLTRRFFHIVAGVLIAITCFFAETRPETPHKSSLYDALRLELRDRLRGFMMSFERVFGAQIVVSGLNTIVTAIFLGVMGLPYIGFLVPATFVLGLLPIIGGVLSNSLIVAAALTLSTRLAIVALVFLIVMHKAQYLLNSHVLGSHLDSPMWIILLAIVVGELLLGVPGIVLAPALLHYVRVELKSLPVP